MTPAFFQKWLGVELIAVSAKEKLVAAAGGGLAIFLLLFLTARALPPAAGALGVIGSMGASAVLLFGVPHGALSQPWPVIAGHAGSALIGVLCARWIPWPAVAAGIAVGLSIGMMHQLKCIHPPGGATAFAAVLGGDAVRNLGFGFVLFPVLTNAVAMVALAVVINGLFAWRRYPAILNKPAHPLPPPAPGEGAEPSHEEVLAAVRELDSFVDITEEDLLRLVNLLERRPGAAARDRAGAIR